jgi:histone H3/H4
MAEVYVVTSKIKKMIKEQSGCNTSAETIALLSEKVENLCKEAIANATSDGRKTVMARDVN